MVRIDDNDKLREKVNEALAVFNDYIKNQKPDTAGPHDAPASEAIANEKEVAVAKL